MQVRNLIPETPSPFHAGEQAVQSRLGVRESIEPWARQVVRPFLPDQHREFYTELPFLVAAARDEGDRPWLTLLVGEPGFVRSPDAERLTISPEPLPGDALGQALQEGADVGLLGIDLAARRRNRVNGRVTGRDDGVLEFAVGQSFGNCPQYITERDWRWVPAAEPPAVDTGDRLTEQMQSWVRSADTFFIASGHDAPAGRADDRTYGMDASHRGGAPGFVRVEDASTIVFPDYAGNNHFNTIGNLVMDPRVGVTFVDFERGSLLQITGRASIDWDSAALADHPGAQRLVIIEIDEVRHLDGALPLRWSAPRDAVRSLRLIDKIPESDDVASFVFASRDGGPLPDFEAGQHLPIQVRVPGHDAPLTRTYSLSNGPGGDGYRISVKREPRGIVSRHLHDIVEVGDIVSASSPAGEFVLEPGGRPAVLISAGIGITPMLSMLHELVRVEDAERDVWFIHGARDGAHAALVDEARALVGSNSSANLHVSFSRPRSGDRDGVDYDREGRIDGALIEDLLPDLDADYYLCGPTAFLAGVSAGLVARGVDAGRIHAETFGPSA